MTILPCRRAAAATLALGLAPRTVTTVGMLPTAGRFLLAVMIMVSVAIFDWHSIAPETLKPMPYGETAVTIRSRSRSGERSCSVAPQDDDPRRLRLAAELGAPRARS